MLQITTQRSATNPDLSVINLDEVLRQADWHADKLESEAKNSVKNNMSPTEANKQSAVKRRSANLSFYKLQKDLDTKSASSLEKPVDLDVKKYRDLANACRTLRNSGNGNQLYLPTSSLSKAPSVATGTDLIVNVIKGEQRSYLSGSGIRFMNERSAVMNARGGFYDLTPVMLETPADKERKRQINMGLNSFAPKPTYT